MIKSPPASIGDARDVVLIPRSGRIPWSRKWHPTPVFLSGKFCGQRSLEGYSPGGHQASDTTERLTQAEYLNSCFVQATVRLPALFWALRYLI